LGRFSLHGESAVHFSQPVTSLKIDRPAKAGGRFVGTMNHWPGRLEKNDPVGIRNYDPGRSSLRMFSLGEIGRDGAHDLFWESWGREGSLPPCEADLERFASSNVIERVSWVLSNPWRPAASPRWCVAPALRNHLSELRMESVELCFADGGTSTTEHPAIPQWISRARTMC
jgi:hypothetical protein